MNLDERLDFIINLHGEYHLGRPGLSDEDFKQTIKQLIEDEIEEYKWHRTIGDE